MHRGRPESPPRRPPMAPRCLHTINLLGELPGGNLVAVCNDERAWAGGAGDPVPRRPHGTAAWSPLRLARHAKRSCGPELAAPAHKWVPPARRFEANASGAARRWAPHARSPRCIQGESAGRDVVPRPRRKGQSARAPIFPEPEPIALRIGSFSVHVPNRSQLKTGDRRWLEKSGSDRHAQPTLVGRVVSRVPLGTGTWPLRSEYCLSPHARGRWIPRVPPARACPHPCPVAPALCCSSGALPPELSRPTLPPEDRRNYSGRWIPRVPVPISGGYGLACACPHQPPTASSLSSNARCCACPHDCPHACAQRGACRHDAMTKNHPAWPRKFQTPSPSVP